jgi:ArsR family transcriptional regulator
LRDSSIDIEDFIAIAKALSDSNRVRALLALRKGELCVCQIIELLGLAPSTVSKHMSILRQAELVTCRKDSRWVYYRLPEIKKKSTPIGTIIQMSLSVLACDEQVIEDDVRMNKIESDGLEAICKRQRGYCGR